METIVTILIPSLFVVGLVTERLFPARPLPKVKRWLAKGIFFFLLTGAANAAIPALVAVAMGPHTPLHLSGLPTLAAAGLGFLASDFVAYWIHRTMHRFPGLWRWTHQMHHSAERMDLAGMTYNHPFDILLSFGLPSLAVGVLGLSPDAGALAGFIGFLYAVIQHSNVRTPHFLGYVLQRPEMHALHHERGVHAYNYGNLPLWDMMFGTYRNPASFPAQYGFWDGASSRLGALLVGRDVGQRG